jgi:hypothetical protein
VWTSSSSFSLPLLSHDFSTHFPLPHPQSYASDALIVPYIPQLLSLSHHPRRNKRRRLLLLPSSAPHPPGCDGGGSSFFPFRTIPLQRQCRREEVLPSRVSHSRLPITRQALSR